MPNRTAPPPSVALPAEDGHLRHLRDLLVQLDIHIARLGLLLDLPLHTEEGLSQALQGEAPANTHAHQGHLPAQLRGLLVLRYDLMVRCTEDVGPDVTRELLLDAEQTLRAHGFHDGADGIPMSRLQAT